MRSSAIPLPAMIILAAVLAAGLARPVAAQSAPHAGDIPQSLRVEHDHTLEQLGILSRRKTPVGAEARKALTLFRQHLQREEDFILPPLTLLPQLADGKACRT